MKKTEKFREWLARKLIVLALNIDPGNKFLMQDGKYKLERNWRQPKSAKDFVPNFIPMSEIHGGDRGW